MTRKLGTLVALVLALGASRAPAQPIRFRGPPVDEPFLLNLQSFNTSLGVGARALGMAGAFIGVADDATSASWNPAGLAFLIRPEVSVVGDGTRSNLTTTGFVDTDPFGNVVQLRRDPNRDEGTATGLSFLSVAYPVKLDGRRATIQLSYHRQVRPLSSSSEVIEKYQLPPYEPFDPSFAFDRRTRIDSSGGFDTVSLGLGTTVSSRLTFGATLNGWFGSPQNTRTTETTSFDPHDPAGSVGVRTITVEERRLRVRGLSVNVGFLYRPTSWLSVGGVYRSGWVGSIGSTLSYRTQGLDFFVPDGATESVLAPVSYQGRAESSGSLSWPAAYGLGVAVRPLSKLVFAFDYTRQEWSRGRAELPFIAFTCRSAAAQRICDGTGTYVTPVLLPAQIFSPQPGPDSGPRSQLDLDVFAQRDQESFRAGAEYVLFLGPFVVPIRAGLYRIDSVAPYFESAGVVRPSLGRLVADPGKQFLVGYTVGLGVGLGGLFLDAAFVRDTSSDDREQIEPPGPDTGHRELRNTRVLVALTYRF